MTEMIYVYEQMPDDLTINGDALIDWADLPEISRVLNDKFTFYGNYKLNGQNVEKLKKDHFIKALTENGTWQYFEIFNVKKNLYSISVTARFIGAMANKNFIEKSFTPSGNGTMIMTNLFNSLAFPQKFTYTSNIPTVHQFTANQVKPIDAIIGSNNGNQNLVGVTGGEFDVDNYDLKLVKQIGVDNNYRVDFGVNLEAIETEIDNNYYNSLYLIGAIPENDYDQNKDPITYKYFEVEGVTDANRRIAKRENTNCKTVEELKAWGQSLFDKDRIHETKATHRVNMVALEHTIEYGELYRDLAALHFGDIAYCYVSELDLDLRERMVEYVWFPTLQKYKTVVLGNSLSKYTSRVQTDTQKLADKIANRTETLVQSILDATAWITGNKGGHVVFRPEKAPSEILIMDTQDVATAKKVWCWNLNGLGYSDNGINGPFGVAITSKGEIVADFIKAGTISADVFETSFNALGDQLKLVAGALQAWNDGKKIMELTKQGLEFWHEETELGTIGTRGEPFPQMMVPDPDNPGEAIPLRIDGKAIIIDSNEKGDYIAISPKTGYGIVMAKHGWIYQKGQRISLTGDDLVTVQAPSIRLIGDVDIVGSLKINGTLITPGTGGGGGGNLGTREEYAKNMITAEFNVDYNKMFNSWVNFGRIKAWGIANRSVFDELNAILRQNGVSPVFFWAYEGSEGYHSSLSFLNHFYTNGSNFQEECRRTAAWVRDTSNTNGNLAWYDAQYPYYTSPADKQAVGNAYMAETTNGMIARVMLQGTAAATWAMFDPVALSGSVNGVQDYGDPFAHQMNLIKSWQTDASFIPPIDRPIIVTSEFGWRTDPFGSGAQVFHNAIDLVGGTGPNTNIYASGPGTVVFAGWENSYGYYVIIRHADGLFTGYAHNSSLAVSNGQTVSQGQKIANMGTTGDSTGEHSHFQFFRNGPWPSSNNDFINPRDFINF